jgi:Protein of unknown function (DUF2948)
VTAGRACIASPAPQPYVGIGHERNADGPVTAGLKLIALDAEDLSVLSAHMQDAVLVVADMAYLPADKRFAVIANRFDWTAAAKAEVAGADRSDALFRHRAALRFERVLGAKVSGINLQDKRQTLNILALQFDEHSAPAGAVTIICAGGAAVRLEIECLEVELKDLGAVWAAKAKPDHDQEPPTKM